MNVQNILADYRHYVNELVCIDGIYTKYGTIVDNLHDIDNYDKSILINALNTVISTLSNDHHQTGLELLPHIGWISMPERHKQIRITGELVVSSDRNFKIEMVGAEQIITKKTTSLAHADISEVIISRRGGVNIKDILLNKYPIVHGFNRTHSDILALHHSVIIKGLVRGHNNGIEFLDEVSNKNYIFRQNEYSLMNSKIVFGWGQHLTNNYKRSYLLSNVHIQKDQVLITDIHFIAIEDIYANIEFVRIFHTSLSKDKLEVFNLEIL